MGSMVTGGYRVIVGDCRRVLAAMDPDSVDAVVTDPPYGLGFMGKAWDKPGTQTWHEEWAREVFRVLKPGGRLLAFGGTRTHHRIWCAIEDAGFVLEDTLAWMYGQGFPKHKSKLKPAWEPVAIARKGHVTPLNVDACRIGGSGRWPANVVLDDEAARMLDAQAGERRSGARAAGVRKGMGYRGMGYHGAGGDGGPAIEASTGGASRFFYCPKSPRRERNAGLPDGMINDHPTVKPINLMRWLVKLVTEPGALVLDPFAGSGSTGVACLLEGRRFIGVEQDPEYAAVAEARLEAARGKIVA